MTPPPSPATDPDAFIAAAIRRGHGDGLPSLTPAERAVFLIAEAEADCDMEGIDALFDRYGTADLLDCAGAFSAVGATAIGTALGKAVRRLPDRPEKLLDEADELIKAREGYDYESLREFAVRQFAPPHPDASDPSADSSNSPVPDADAHD